MTRGLLVGLLLLTGAMLSLHAQTYELQHYACVLQAPLSTRAEAAISKDASVIEALIDVPKDAPNDLGIGAYVKDDDGHWFQIAHPQILKPGRQTLQFNVSIKEAWRAEPYHGNWDLSLIHHATRYGLYFWSAESNRCAVTIVSMRTKNVVEDHSQTLSPSLLDIRYDQLDSNINKCRVRTGERWSLRFRTNPMPINPYNDAAFIAELQVAGPDGAYTVPGFYQRAARIVDSGDGETVLLDGESYFACRFRPRQAGVYKLRLHAVWNPGTDKEFRRELEVPSLVVGGEDWDEYIRIDTIDQRFFASGAQPELFWPLGLNIHSVYDPHAAQCIGSRLTPNRLSHAYKRYFDRLSLAGGNCVEIWMAGWNMALEWCDEWDGYHGLNDYNEGNAQILDEILDYAYVKGIRVLLVVNNHGQASNDVDEEWEYSPFNVENGGPIKSPLEYFTHPAALRAQQSYRRYLVARYADHPAILAWKLFSEMNLTSVGEQRNGRGPEMLRIWHEDAFEKWTQLDIYEHLLTSHWSHDYRKPDHSLLAAPGMDFVNINAYHPRTRNSPTFLLADVIYDSAHHERFGLGTFQKPIFISEYGCDWQAGPSRQMFAEHLSGPWAALMSGHGSGPFLWWHEWVDQRDYWYPYRAVSRFMKNEDFRSPQARSVGLSVLEATPNAALWSRGWFKPGLIYGYLLDRNWGYDGKEHPLHHDVRLNIGEQISAGSFEIEWWDASLGEILSSRQIQHTQGALQLTCPDFRRHLAFKLRRISRE